MIADVLLVAAGLVLLAVGADRFVVAAGRLAATVGMSPVVIGAVVVGFGTGVPELLVSGSASAAGSLDIAIGNVVGSNLANLTLVLGVAGVVARAEAVPGVLRREAPLMAAAVVLLAVLMQGGLGRLDGAVLLVALVASTFYMVRSSTSAADERTSSDDALDDLVEEVAELVEEGDEATFADVARASTGRDVVRALLALGATVGGAQLLVTGAQSIAEAQGLSGGFVGLTIVALGTSLPELVTAIQSARRGETALLVGNVLGSNVFNSTAVAAAASFIGPAQLTDPGLTVVAGSAMVVVALLAWLFLGLGSRLRRWEAVLLLAVYGATLPLTV